MVAIFTGLGAGYARGSANLLGGAGQLGSSLLGRAGESVLVNAATGNLLISHQDEFLIGRGPDVAVGRTYNSLLDAGTDGDNGDNWQQSTTRRVFGLTGTANTAGSTIRRQDADGTVLVYSYDGARGAYVAADGPGADDSLVLSGSQWVWQDGGSLSTESYEAHGADNWLIANASDTSGNALTFTYVSGTERLDKVTTADGSWTQYTWSGTAIASVITGYTDLATSSAKALTRVLYGYDGQGRLATVTTDLTPGDSSVSDGAKYVVTYTYDGASNRVASIAQTDGSLLAIAYDGSGRVQTLTQTVASGVTRVTTLTYGSGYTTVTGPDGQVTRLDYDGLDRLTKITAPAAYSGATAQTVQFSYDAAGNLDTVTNGAGEVTSYDYDAHGNTTLITDATGHTVTRTYSDTNRLLTELTTGADRDGASVAHYTQYVYDTAGNLRFLVNAAGQTTEYRYDASGQLVRTIDYAEQRMTPPGATPISEASAMAWAAAIADRSSVRVTDNSYDARGNLVQSKAYGIADASGNPLTTEGTTTASFVYDQAGNLIERYRPGETHETFLYDGMGRLYSSTDKNGGTTTILFADASTTTTITTALGLTTTSVYNKAGELLSYAESGASTTAGTASYQYDSAGRLRVATDASGRSSYVYYDKAGRKVAEVNQLGEITEYRYDAAGRVTATIAYATALAGTPLTTIANPAATADLSTLLPTASANDVWSWTVYDDAGRVIQVIDNLGSTVTYEYDTEGKLAKTYAWYTKLSAAALTGFKTTPPTTLQLPAANAKDTFSRVFYNKAGQQIAALDGEGYLTESIRDGAGLVTQTTSYAAATNAADRAAGSLATLKAGITLNASADQTAYSVYDGQGLLRFTVNAEGGITGFTYDDAGRLIKTVAYAAKKVLTDFTYDAVKAAVTANAADRTSWVVYDSAGRAAYTVDAEGGVVAFSYNIAGQVVKTIAYDNLYASAVTLGSLGSWAANTAQANDGANRVTRTWYNARGEAVYSLDAETYATGYTYDAEGRALSVTRYGATSSGTGITVSDATTIAQLQALLSGTPTSGAITTSQTYDNAGRVLTATDGELVVTRNFYNALGQLTDVKEAYTTADEVTTHYTYDGAGRVLTVTGASGTSDAATVTYAYDGLGNKTGVTDARGNTTSYSYDRLGQVLTVTDALSGVATFQYDAFGKVVKATTPGGDSTYNYYDNLGRLTLTVNAERYVTTVTYNRFSEVSSSSTYKTPLGAAPAVGTAPSTSGLGTAVELADYYYDRLGRVTLKVDAEGYVDASAYNAFGQLVDFIRYEISSFSVSGGGATPAQIQAAYTAAAQQQTAANNAQTAAATAAAAAAAAAAAVPPLQSVANAAQADATALLAIANQAAADAAQAQSAANTAQAAADAALAYAVGLQTGNAAEIQAAHDAAIQAQNTATAAQTAANTAATTASQAQTAATNAQNTANTAQTAYNSAVTAYNTAASNYTTAQNTANAKQTTSNASAAAAATAQTNANNLATQVSQNVVGAAYAAPIPTLQALSASYTAQANAIAAQAASATDPNQYLALYQAYQQMNALAQAVNAEITSVQAGNPLSANGKSYVNSAKGFTAAQLSTYQTLQNNYTAAQATATTAAATAATDLAAYNAAQTTANQKLTLKNQANTTKNNAQTAWNNAQAAADTAATTASQAAAAAATAQTNATAAQSAADTAQAYYLQLAANPIPGGTPAQIAAAQALADQAQDDADAAQAIATTAANSAAQAQSSATAAQTNANTKQAAANSAQTSANQAAANATQAQNDADAAQANADAALAYAHQLEDGPPGGIGVSQLGTGAETIFQYDERGQLTKSIDAQGFYESFAYDAFGLRKSSTAKSSTISPSGGGQTTYTYDKRGLLVSETPPITAYNAGGDKVIKTTYQYDSRGNLVTQTIYEGATVKQTTTYGYDLLDRRTSTTHQSFTAYTINNSTKAVSSSTVAAPAEKVTYDKNGNVLTTQNAALEKTYFFYDQLGRKTVEVSALGVYTAYGYDADGNVTSIKIYENTVGTPANPGGTSAQAPNAPSGTFRQTIFAYDGLNRMTSSTVVLPNGYKTGTWNGTAWTNATTATLDTVYQYDYLGNVVKVTDPNGGSSFSYYDRLGRKTAQVDAEGYLTSWTYNSDGNVLTERRYATRYTGTPTVANPPSVSTNANDRVTTYTYDKVGNRLTEARSGVLVGNATFTGTSAVTSTIQYTYNGLGQVLTKIEATGDTFTYQYDLGGRLTLEKRPQYTSNAGNTVTPQLNYYYDSLGDLVRTVQAGNADAAERVTTYTYDSAGRMTAMTDAENKQRKYLYDAAGRLVLEYYSRTIVGLDGNPLAQPSWEGIGYRYDAAGQNLGQGFYKSADSGATWTFQAAADGAVSTTIEYNSFGDVTKISVNGVTQQENTYDLAGRMWKTTAGDGIAKYFGYDMNGNQTVAITSAGADISGKSFDQARLLISGPDVNGTYTVYDKRNLATSVVEEGRQLTATGTSNLTTSRSYNAFGEVASETNAASVTVTYTYNTMGRKIRAESPTISITMEDGTARYIKPSEDYYYDKSGRLIATRDANGTYATGGSVTNGTSKAANTGNLTMLTLLNGTGYNGSEALVTVQTFADGGVTETSYDILGNARKIKVLISTAANPVNNVYRVTEQSFDKLGRLIKATRPGTVLTPTPTYLIDSYTYDELGQLVEHGNNLMSTVNGSGQYLEGNTEVTLYDIQGRVTGSRAYGNVVTENAYSWQTSFGGWRQTTTYKDGGTLVPKSSFEDTDLFGRTVAKSDLGGHTSTYAYDAGGRLTTITTTVSSSVSASYQYAYYNTGQLKSSLTRSSQFSAYYYSDPSGYYTVYTTTATTDQTATYTYDAVGNRLTEVGTTVVNGTTTKTFKNEVAVYDALGRLSSIHALATDAAPEANSLFTYDANGNIRSKVDTLHVIGTDGAAGAESTVSNWFRYDSMNRVTLNNGALSNGVIVRRPQGGSPYYLTLAPQSESILYDKAGQRTAVTVTNAVFGDYGVLASVNESRESYTYDPAGRLIRIDQVSGASSVTNPTQAQIDAPPAAPTTGGTRRSAYTYDLMGRQLTQIDYKPDGTTQVFSRTMSYNTRGQLYTDYNTSLKTDGKTYTSNTTNNYGAGASYALGAVVSASTYNYVTGGSAKTATTNNVFTWWDSALQLTTTYDADGAGTSSPAYTTTYTYNALGQLTSAYIGDGMPRTVTFTLDEGGQIIRRDETKPSNAPSGQTGAPHEIWYRFGEREFGYVGNNGSDNVTDMASIADRQATPPAAPGTFHNGATQALAAADFTRGIEHVTSYDQGSKTGSYTVQQGDDLQSLAQRLYGDASLWYKIAEANGLNGTSGLIEGQQLTLPAGVERNTYNASTYNPYDPAEAIGDLSPTAAKPPKKPSSCGFIGQILSMVVAVAASYFLGPILGNVVSQGFNNLIGIQHGFSFKSLGMSVLSAGVAAGVGEALGTGAIFGSQFAGDVIRGAASSAITQGIGVATGLQDKFSWAGVAAAGVAAGVGGAVLRGMSGDKGHYADGKETISDGHGGLQTPSKGSWVQTGEYGFAAQAVSSAAASISAAATRSAISGRNFGDSLIASIPDIVGQIAGGALGRALGGSVWGDKDYDGILGFIQDISEAPTTLGRAVGEGVADVIESAFRPDFATMAVNSVLNIDDGSARDGSAQACFVAGTKIHTARGEIPIENIRAGDFVLAMMENGHDLSIRRRSVMEVYRFQNKQIMRVAVETLGNKLEELYCTEDHRFWIEGKKWVEARELSVGDRVRTLRGENAAVVAAEITDRVEDVFNFAVDVDHTYFVGSSGVWVHNEYRPAYEDAAGDLMRAGNGRSSGVKNIKVELDRFSKIMRNGGHDQAEIDAVSRILVRQMNDAGMLDLANVTSISDKSAIKFFQAIRDTRPAMPDVSKMASNVQFNIYASFVLAYGDQAAISDFRDGRRVIVGLRHENQTTIAHGQGTFDDKIAVIWHDARGGHTRIFTANTDPSAQYDAHAKGPASSRSKVYSSVIARFGDGEDANGDSVADLGRLPQGVYRFEKGVSKKGRDMDGDGDRDVLRPISPLPMERDTDANGYFTTADPNRLAIGSGQTVLFHPGGMIGNPLNTASAGCQTIRSADYANFWSALGSQQKFDYVLRNTK